MDEKELKQFEDNEPSSAEEIQFYWNLFNVDLCQMYGGNDVKSLFDATNVDDADSIYLDKATQENEEKKKKLKENASIIISNIYGKIFILYPQHTTLISMDSLRLTNYSNSIDNIPDRGISPPNTLYRSFNHIKVWLSVSPIPMI